MQVADARRGAGGVRLDAVAQLVEESGDISDTEGTHCALRWLYASVKNEHPDSLILSEAYTLDQTDHLRYLGDEWRAEADLVFDVPRHKTLFSSATAQDKSAFVEVLNEEGDNAHRMAGYLGLSLIHI